MSKQEFMEMLRSQRQPVVLDFWAPWCAPCRIIEPAVEKLGEKYVGRVALWKVNADERPDLLSTLHIYGIPTLIAFHGGVEVGRHTGVASATVLEALFESTLSGKKPEQRRPAINDRFLRLGAGLALVALAIISGLSGAGLALAGIGGLIMFTAVYDRCPIYRLMSGRLKGLFRRDPT